MRDMYIWSALREGDARRGKTRLWVPRRLKRLSSLLLLLLQLQELLLLQLLLLELMLLQLLQGLKARLLQELRVDRREVVPRNARKGVGAHAGKPWELLEQRVRDTVRPGHHPRVLCHVPAH